MCKEKSNENIGELDDEKLKDIVGGNFNGGICQEDKTNNQLYLPNPVNKGSRICK
nr:hypothetical protein [uncultured Butyrivibrio sp.]